MSVEETERVCKKYLTLLSSARSRDIEFSLNFSEVRKMTLTKYCHYSGIELVNPPSGKVTNLSFFDKHNHRTIDRIDRNKGYIPGNVVASCNAVNYLKANFIEGCMGIDAAVLEEFSKFPLDIRIKIFTGLANCGLLILTETTKHDLHSL